MTGADLHIIMPLVILAAGSVAVLLAGAIRPGWHLYGTAGAFAAAALLWGIIVPADGSMPGLVITPVSRFFSCLTSAAGLVALLLAAGYNRRRGIGGEEFPATLLFALTGMAAACSAGNLLMLFVGLESFTFAFYILVAIEREGELGGEAGLKYLLNGTLAAALLAMGIALVYCDAGTLRLAELAAAPHSGNLYRAGIALMLVGLGFKLSLAPAHLWTPDVYQGAPAPVTALLSTASKAASLAAVLLVLPLGGNWQGMDEILKAAALLSVVVGNLAALRQTGIKRMLAWSSIAQMGYAALALSAAPAGGRAAAVFYLAAYTAAGLAAFGGVAVLSVRSDRDILDEYRGAGYSFPLVGAVLAVSLFSLAGIPPFGGFMGKLTVFTALIRTGEAGVAVIAILAALTGVFFYLRVVVLLYMQRPDENAPSVPPLSPAAGIALIVPTLATLVLGIFPQPLFDLLSRILS